MLNTQILKVKNKLNLQDFNFYVENIEDDFDSLNTVENVHLNLVKKAIYTLFRIFRTNSENPDDVFSTLLEGARYADMFSNNGSEEVAIYLVDNIDVTKLTDETIINTCKLVTFDVWYNTTMDAVFAIKPSEVNPDKETIENIRIMVKRLVSFYDGIYASSKNIYEDFTFEPDGVSLSDGTACIETGKRFGGYTQKISSGTGELLADNTLWTISLAKYQASTHQLLRLVSYYIMGMRSKKPMFNGINVLGVYNPRYGKTYKVFVNDVPDFVFEFVEQNILD